MAQTTFDPVNHRLVTEIFKDVSREAVYAQMDNRFKELEKEGHQLINRTSIGRNTPCPCGSGRKYKKCCIDLT